jgi:hypothetical protein
MKKLFENWNRYLNESLAANLTDKMHAQWLQGYRQENGDKPRLKPIPDNPSIEQVEGYEGVEMVDGVAHQNINQEASKIEPSLKHKLNGAPAVDYAAATESIPINSTGGIEKLASEFHVIWMKHNSWQKDSNPNLFIDYHQLPGDEKLKDLDQLKVALDLQYPGNEEIQQLFNQVYKETR